MDHIKEIRRELIRIIRDASREGLIVQREELFEELAGQGLLRSGDPAQWRRIESGLQQVVTENEDIHQLSGKNGIPHYYSSLSVSPTYAGILVRKGENSLIAEIVRENSLIYPRPVPLDMFLEPPFELTSEDIANCLSAMGKPGDYQDIAATTTSAGTVFLYSNSHLSPEHAAMLAESIDVGGSADP